MPHHRRHNSYKLRDLELNVRHTYDGIKTNPLSYIDSDIHSIDSDSISLAELYVEHWTVDAIKENIYLKDPYVFITESESDHLKNYVHPLKWLFNLIENRQLLLYYSPTHTTLTIVYSFLLKQIDKKTLNLFEFYSFSKTNETTKFFFQNIFTLDDYQSIIQLNNNDINAMNAIDFIYQEIQAITAIDNNYNQTLNSCEDLLKNDVIQLKDHQKKSINWMLKREQELSSLTVYSPLHRCHDLNDNLFYVHVIYGIPLNVNELDQWKCEQFSLSGGILCDEMGLGKTMCVLLTSLLNKCPNEFLSENNSVLIKTTSDDNDIFLPEHKKFKPDDQTLSACVCGKIAKISKKNQHLFDKFISVCAQCSRSIHNSCFLHDNKQETFICPYCEQRFTDNNQLLSTNATLIIAPEAIIDQWIEEINKHFNCSLNIYMYQGIVNKIPIPDRTYLAKQDFIFCSYENLKKDIHHNEVCSKEHYSTRTQTRKYEYLISPLLRLKFWRLVLDEAQMVDSPNTPASKMAKSLAAHHRWFVTGTPFHRSINDLEGIFQYLFPSNNIPRDQASLLLRNKQRVNEVFITWIINFLKLVARRTSRQCLNDLPEQYERIIRLQFSQLERVYYNRIWSQCRDDFKREFQHLWQKRERDRNDGILPEQITTWTFESNNEIDMNDIHFLSSTARSCLQTPLIKLRCLCDHPQVGAHGVRHNDPALVHYYNRFHYSKNKAFSIRRYDNNLETNSSLNKNDQPFTMKDLLDLLTARELESGEDCLRLSLLNFNGLAAIFLIQYEHDITRSITDNNNKNDQHYIKMAIRTYERVIETAEIYKEHFHADSFQVAHAYYNLSYALSSLNKLDNPCTSDLQCKYTSERALDEFKKIKQRHQTQYEHEMNEAWQDFNDKLLKRKDVENDIKNLVKDIATCIQPIENDKIEIQYYLNRDRQFPFTTWNGFLYDLVQQFDHLQKIRENLLIYIEGLKRQPTDDDIVNMAACSKCSLDSDSTNENMCIFCECDIVMKSYNCSLQPEFYSEKQIKDEGGVHLIYYINEILTRASIRSHEATRQLGKLLRTDWNDLLKKLRLENTAARAYSQQLKHLYLLLDEMRQCTSRLEYYPIEKNARPKKQINRYRYNPETIEQERRDFEQQALDYLKQVIKHRQKFNYFQEQQHDYYQSVTPTNLVPSQRAKCPMCHEFFGNDRPDVCFFLCGHFFCNQCTLEWKKHEINQRQHRSRIKCPICRRDIPINSLTVLKWESQNPTTTSSSIDKSMNDNTTTDDVSSPRMRRLIENQQYLMIQGRYGTKVDSIVSFILNLLNESIELPTSSLTTTTNETKPPLKVLVFSQFTDILNVLAISLKLNAISYLQFTSNKILQQFRQDPSITVLLMPLGKGANGLNLTEAQHVILVEPQLHQSVELQAIARVRRLGQKFNTYVYRFIINDTAEEVVLLNSRTAQTVIVKNPETTMQLNNLLTNRSTSFADYELLYEINMAQKIFFKATQSTTADNSHLGSSTIE